MSRGVRQILPTKGVEHTRTYRIFDPFFGCRNELVEPCILIARKPPVHSDYNTNGKDEGSYKMDEPHVRHHKRVGISVKERGADVKSRYGQHDDAQDEQPVRHPYRKLPNIDSTHGSLLPILI